MQITIKAKLVAKRDDLYSDLVFENLDEKIESWTKYITITKLPNWQSFCPTINSIGFLTYEIAKAGEKYYKQTQGIWETYKTDGMYFISFVNESSNISSNKDYRF